MKTEQEMSKLSTCCGAAQKGDVSICPTCFEWADFKDEEL